MRLSTPFDVIEGASLPLATTAQRAQRGLRPWGVTADNSTDSRDAFRVVNDLLCCGKTWFPYSQLKKN